MFPNTYFETLIILSLILLLLLLCKYNTTKGRYCRMNHPNRESQIRNVLTEKTQKCKWMHFDEKKKSDFFFCTIHFWLIVICNVVRIADDFHVSFTNPSVHVCIFGCRCRPIQDGRVPRSAFFWTFNSRLFWKVP